MALARLALKNLGLGQGLVSPSRYRPLGLVSQNQGSMSERGLTITSSVQQQRWEHSSSSAAGEKSGSGGRPEEVAVAEKERDRRGKKLGIFPRRRRGSGSLWRNDRGGLHDLVPFGLSNALMQATENINKLLYKFAPSRLVGRVREKDDSYKVRFHLPGLTREDVKVTVEDGFLRIVGEHKEEEEDEEPESEEDDEYYWAARGFYGYYDTALVLPEDAKADGIKAEMKDGVLTVIIPKAQNVKKDVKEVKVL